MEEVKDPGWGQHADAPQCLGILRLRFAPAQNDPQGIEGFVQSPCTFVLLSINTMPHRFLALLVACLFVRFVAAQPLNFAVDWQELSWPNVPAIHSFACAAHDGKWLFIGGRTNGLHGFHPPLAFPNSGRNAQVTVFDPASGQRWDAALSGLPDSLREPLSSSNMQFHQDADRLYIVGGYGWQTAAANFVTFPTLTAVDVPALMQAVIQGAPIDGHFRQVQDSALAVCGGHLGKVDSTYLLVFGHRFDGIYNRSDTTGFHVQAYTHAVRRFRVRDDGQTLSLALLPASADTARYRRRDYNLVPQVFVDGSHGYRAFSGVFQKGLRIPYFFPVNVHASVDSVVPGFYQHLASYHCAVLPIHDAAQQAMSTVFFGGEAMYLPGLNGQLIEDSLIPFVKTVSVVRFQANGQADELALADTLPGFLGSNSQFFPAPGLVAFSPDGILDLNQLSGRTLVGYVMGGIESPLDHINLIDPAMSTASARVFAIYVDPAPVSAETAVLRAPLTLAVAGLPARERLDVRLALDAPAFVRLDLLDLQGRVVAQVHAGELAAGVHRLGQDLSALPSGLYYLQARCAGYRQVVQVSKL
jgi:hypothetical protein